MSLSVTFYKCSDDPRKADKNLTTAGVVTTLHPLENISNMECAFLINYENQSQAMNSDYFKIDSYYYEITNREYVPAKGIRIVGKIDSLKSLWDSVKNCSGIVARSANKYNGEINDPLYPLKQRSNVDVQDLKIGYGNKDEVIFAYIE